MNKNHPSNGISGVLINLLVLIISCITLLIFTGTLSTQFNLNVFLFIILDLNLRLLELPLGINQR